MREDPGLDEMAIASCLSASTMDSHVAAVTVPAHRLRPRCSGYEAGPGDGIPFFVKVRFGPVFEPSRDALAP